MFKNEELTLFKDLSDANKLLIINNLDKVEFFIPYDNHLWFKKIDSKIDLEGVYRIVSTKPSINWDHVSDIYKYMATDKSGSTYLFDNIPILSIDHMIWCKSSGRTIGVSGFKSFNPGTCDWRDSLVQRNSN